jgi:phosphoribosyl 1,2-cyclic phosphodiesterase
MKLAKDTGVKNIIFTHHDHASTDRFIDKILKDLRSKHPNINIQAAADGRTIILK